MTTFFKFALLFHIIVVLVCLVGRSCYLQTEICVGDFVCGKSVVLNPLTVAVAVAVAVPTVASF